MNGVSGAGSGGGGKGGGGDGPFKNNSGGGGHDDDGRPKYGTNKSSRRPGNPQEHETPSQLTLATQDTSIGSSMMSATSSYRNGGRSSTPLLLLPRRRQRPQPPQQQQQRGRPTGTTPTLSSTNSTSRVLNAQRLADIAAHEHGDDEGGALTPALVRRNGVDEHAGAIARLPRHDRDTNDALTDEVLRRRRRQVVWLASGSITTLVGFVIVVLPTPALLLLASWMALTAASVVALRQYLIVWWNQQLLQHGLGPYLPDNLYRLLTNESIHSFMTDDTFMLENRHLLLYFLPLPPPALERYVQRLAPRHVQRLHRPGLGHLLGESAMRIIVGRDEYNRQFQRRQPGAVYDADLVSASDATAISAATPAAESMSTQRPTLEVIIERPSSHQAMIMSSSRLDQDDEGSDSLDLGVDVTADQVLDNAITDEQARRMVSVLPIATTSWVDSGSELVPNTAEPGGYLASATTPVAGFSLLASSPAESALTTPGATISRVSNVDNDQAEDLPSAGATTSDDVLSLAEEYAEEELVLTQAVINAVYDGVWTPLSRYFVSAAEETAGPVTARLVTYGLGVSAVSTVLGLFLGMVGYRRGIYRRPTIMQAYPRENTLYTTIMLGIAGTGVTLLAHWHLNRGKKGRSYFYSQFSRRSSRKG